MPGAKERIYDRISGLMLPGDYNLKDLPELLENNIFVELPEEVRAIYTKLEKDFISAVNSGLVTAMNAASASSKLRQIANGGVFLDKDKRDEFGLFLPKQKREWANLHSEKTKALRDLVEELQGSPLLVAYDFEHDLDRLRTAFKDGVFACDYNMKQFPKLERDWNEGKISLLFGHPQSIGHGLNLQENCQDLCWHSLTWNLELYEQFIDRVWREGNNRPHVTVHHLLAQNTLDELIYGRLQTKATTQQDLFNALKEWAKERA
jgi:SNF2 family DNA or RNA helicase